MHEDSNHSEVQSHGGAGGHGPPRCINVEGTNHEWNRSTITTEEIIALGGWDPALGAIMIDQHNNERQLEPGEVIEVSPGQSFCRRVRFVRGLSRADRIGEEVGRIAQRYPGTEFKDGWVCIPAYSLPPDWSRPCTPVAFPIEEGYPATRPYGLYVPSDLLFKGRPPSNFNARAEKQPPFPGPWGVLSWEYKQDGWKPGSHVGSGSTLLMFVESFALRFAEGA